jgi:hypothetical protein
MEKLRTGKKPGQYQRHIELPLDRLRELARGMYSQASLAALLGVSHETLSRRLQEPRLSAV